MRQFQKIRSKIGLIVLIYIAFISLGLPDGLLGVAWPTMRESFGLPLDALGILLIASTMGYLTSSFFSSVIMAKLGVGGLLAASSCSTALALIGYTLAPVWWMVPVLGIFAGLGAGAIDAGLNTYVEANYGEGLMQWLHASFGVGVTMGPIIMSMGLNVFGTWRVGYVVVGVAQLVLAVSFIITMPMWKSQESVSRNTFEVVSETPDTAETDTNQVEKTIGNSGKSCKAFQPRLRQTLKHGTSWLSALLFFIYTGVELSLGHWAYTLLTESRGIAPEVAGLWAGSYWATFTIGRILAGFLSLHIGSRRLVNLGLMLALIGTLLLWWSPSQGIALLGVALIGFAIAPIFPGMVSSTSYRVGLAHTSNTISMQIAAAGLGGAVLPGLAGVLARNIYLEVIPVFLVVTVTVLFILHTIPVTTAESNPYEFINIMD